MFSSQSKTVSLLQLPLPQLPLFPHPRGVPVLKVEQLEQLM